MKKAVLFVATILLIIFGAETIYSNNDILVNYLYVMRFKVQ